MQSETKQEIKFIYWFTHYNLDSPSVRYRGRYPLEYLRLNHNIDAYFFIPGYRPKIIVQFLKVYFSALLFRKTGSAIIIQRIHSKFIYSTLLKFLIKCRPNDTYYDLDDADYLRYPPETIFYFIKNCSGVFVGSRALAKNLSKLNKNIILNTSPTPDPHCIKKKKNATITVGWIGDFGGPHKEGLVKYFFPALRELNFKIKLILLGVGRKNETDFNFIADYFIGSPNILLDMPRNIDWNNEKEIHSRISEFDIGIATLQDNEYDISRSGFKLKQYLNNGIPVLSSDLPENNYFLQDGVNGFFLLNTRTI